MRGRTGLRLALAGLLAARAGGVLLASGGAYSRTKHGDPSTGVTRLPEEARGDCGQCHDEHASRQGVSNGGPFPYALFAADDNRLCATCHSASGANGVYGGSASYERSSHATSFAMVWPGPQPAGRLSGDAGKCVNCHDPHGVADPDGTVPAMTFAREEALCLPCHDGSPAAANVAADFLKPSRHPIGLSGRHDEAERGDPSRFAAANRHAECVDCHNPHAVQENAVPPTAPAASGRLLGVSRVRVVNGAPGTRPLYTWLGPDDVSPAAEYEICFKCHSSWTTQPLGQSDMAMLVNPNNPSYHPIEAAGKNANIAPGAFARGSSASSFVYCSDCHGSDDASRSGPHGSAYPHLLKGSYEAVSRPRRMAAGMEAKDLCFSCHTFAVYADPAAPAATLAASRFNPPAAVNGHAYHVGAVSLSCFACHQSHGSTAYPALIVTGRSPGLATFGVNPSGGACTPTCHAPQTYTVNYAR